VPRPNVLLRRAARATVLTLAACGSPAPATTDAAPGDTLADSASLPDAATPPAPPPGLTRWLVGDPADRVTTARAGVILMGGGTDVDEAFAWQRERIGGGDIVVLRASGADGYNDYLFTDIGGADSVETLLVDTRALALEPYVAWQLAHAEAIFLAGGDQAVYVAAWGGTPVAEALAAAWARGAVIGGTSAGCAFLAGHVYSASAGSVLSSEALDDPYDPRVTLVREVVALPPLAGTVTDTHFAARDRMGRLLAFTARTMADGWATRPLGLGIDERTALLVDEHGEATVVGSGSVYMIAPPQAPERCTAGQPLAWADVPLHELRAGDTVTLPAGTTAVAPRTLSASDGVLSPANPY
jgi:cyanophycinase